MIHQDRSDSLLKTMKSILPGTCSVKRLKYQRLRCEGAFGSSLPHEPSIFLVLVSDLSRAVDATAETVYERLLTDLEYLASYIYTSEMWYIIDLYDERLHTLIRIMLAGKWVRRQFP